MQSSNMCLRLALGAAGGLAGTIALGLIRNANQKWTPESNPPMQGDPAEFMVNQTKSILSDTTRVRVSHSAERALKRLLPLGYGMSFGALFAAARPEIKRDVSEGVLLGLISWAVGFLGWLPKTGLMPPVWKHTPKQIVRPVVEHALYGVTTVEAYRLLKQLAQPSFSAGFSRRASRPALRLWSRAKLR